MLRKQGAFLQHQWARFGTVIFAALLLYPALVLIFAVFLQIPVYRTLWGLDQSGANPAISLAYFILNLKSLGFAGLALSFVGSCRPLIQNGPSSFVFFPWVILLFGSLHILHFVTDWGYGFNYAPTDELPYVSAFSISGFVVVGVAAFAIRLRESFFASLLVRWLFFVLLGWWLFPWLGEIL